MRLGQEGQFLDTGADAHPEPLAASDRDQGLNQLVAIVVRIGPGIHERGQPAHAVGLHYGHHGHQRGHDQDWRDQVADTHSAQEHHAADDGTDQQGRTEVRLLQQQDHH